MIKKIQNLNKDKDFSNFNKKKIGNNLTRLQSNKIKLKTLQKIKKKNQQYFKEMQKQYYQKEKIKQY